MVRLREATVVLAIFLALIFYVRFNCNNFKDQTRWAWNFADNPGPPDITTVDMRREEWYGYSKLFVNKTKEKRFPDVIGIGVKKCGTDAIISFLSFHPFVKTPMDVEAFFFNQKYKNGLEFYKGLMPEVADHELVMEKTPAYFNSPPMNLPGRIKHDLPNAKLILVLCDPVKRAFSDYTHERIRFEKYKAKWVKDYETYDSYLDVYLDRVNRTLVGKNKDILQRHMSTYLSDHAATILEGGMYSIHLPRWTKLFNSSKLLILNGEDFLKNPGPQVEAMQDFLGIPKLLLASDFVRHPETGLFCIRPYWKKDYDFEIERRAAAGWQTQLNCLSDGKGRTRNAKGSVLATEDHIASLRRLYRRFNEELFSMTGIKYF